MFSALAVFLLFVFGTASAMDCYEACSHDCFQKCASKPESTINITPLEAGFLAVTTMVGLAASVYLLARKKRLI
jgi:formate hydrogenlyase subunit 3/multisubunit Na+/H+ antiporter MnhD subunit